MILPARYPGNPKGAKLPCHPQERLPLQRELKVSGDNVVSPAKEGLPTQGRGRALRATTAGPAVGEGSVWKQVQISERVGPEGK